LILVVEEGAIELGADFFGEGREVGAVGEVPSGSALGFTEIGLDEIKRAAEVAEEGF